MNISPHYEQRAPSSSAVHDCKGEDPMLSQSEYQAILVEVRQGVAVLTLNRPERLNAVNSTMHHELCRIFADIQRDPDVRVAVLTGAGRGFCAGGDFSGERSNQPIGGLTLMQRSRLIVDTLIDLEKPIICALNGPAAGLGATIALLCDIVIAARSARIGDTHVKMGITAGDGGAVIWPLLVGINRAKQLLMTGDFVSADEGLRLGLFNQVVDDGESLAAALEVADRLRNGAPFAIQSTKIAINRVLKAVSDLVLPYSLAIEEVSMHTDDHREAVAAFRERREPAFKGS